jgi:dienelactone hydrolase
MQRAFSILASALAISIAGISHVAAKSPDNKALAARVELHTFQSLTLPDTAFLKGDATAGKAVTLVAELRLAQATGKQPLVVLMHGSSGIGSNIAAWARRFNAQGMATLALDSMTGRGLKSVSANQGLLGRLNFTLDIYRALDLIAKDPRIDTSRVALMGFSRGGQGALYASLTRFHELWNKSGVKFVAYVPFYPVCATSYMEDTRIEPAPIAIFHGAKDDYNELAPCKAYAARLVAAKHDVVVHEYPDAHHGFDVPTLFGKVIHAKTSQTGRRCKIKETAPGVLTNLETNAPFSYADACVQLGPHVGGDEEATRAAEPTVDAVLRKAFKM